MDKEFTDFSKVPNWDILSERQRAFVWNYVSTGEAAQSARSAGYSAKSAGQTASRLFHDPLIRGAIGGLRKQLWREAELSQEEARAILAREARSSLGDVLDDSGHIDPRRVKRHALSLRSYRITPGEDGETLSVEANDRQKAVMNYAKLAGWLDKQSDDHVMGGVKLVVNFPPGGGTMMKDER